MPTARRSSTISRVVLAALLALVVFRAGAPAWAQTDVVKSVERLNRKAMEDYDNLEFESARSTLQSALGKLREAGLDETPTAARTYLNLGMLYFTADKDDNRAENQFLEALKIDPAVELDPERATPELQELFATAQKKVARSAKRAPPPARRPAPKPEPPPEDEPDPSEKAPALDGGGWPPHRPIAHGLEHDSVDEAKAGEDIAIRVRMGADVQATRVFLLYRSGGQEEYVEVPMQRGRGTEWVGTIPGDGLGGRTCQYYLEARDAKGRAAVSSGSAISPYIITLTGGERAKERSPLREEDEHPLEKERRMIELQRRAQAKARDADRGYGRLFANLMIGTGIGVQMAGNQYEVAYQFHGDVQRFLPLSVSSSGTATSPLHGALELGVNLDRHLALSVIARLEGTLFNNAESVDQIDPKVHLGGGTSKGTSAFAALARFRYTFGEGRFRPGVHVGLGGGEIRHVLDITGAGTAASPLVDFATADTYDRNPPFQPGSSRVNYVCQDKVPCYDTIRLGYVMASVGGSVYYELATFRNGGVGLILDAAAIFAFSEQFGLNIDIQAGLASHFF